MAITFENAAAEPAKTAPLAIAILGRGDAHRGVDFPIRLRHPAMPALPRAALRVLLSSFRSPACSRSACRSAPRAKSLVAGLVVIAGFMLWNAGLGAYHSGVEWGWWQGPQDCSGPITDLGGAGGLAEKNRDHPDHSLRRSAVAVPRPLARRLQCADLARARRDRGLGRARRVSHDARTRSRAPYRVSSPSSIRRFRDRPCATMVCDCRMWSRSLASDRPGFAKCWIHFRPRDAR